QHWIRIALPRIGILENEHHDSRKRRRGNRCSSGTLYTAVRTIQSAGRPVLEIGLTEEIKASGQSTAGKQGDVRNVTSTVNRYARAGLPSRFRISGRATGNNTTTPSSSSS